MKTCKELLLVLLLFCSTYACAQVQTNFNNEVPLSEKGRFAKAYKTSSAPDYELPAKDIKALLEIEKREMANETKAFQLAAPVPVDIDIARVMSWTEEGEFAYGRYTIRANGALSTSINFDRFFLPGNSEMYVYNENGNMITGPVTEAENNPNHLWGSWVYRGAILTIEIKTPVKTKGELQLHASNIAYGYKEVYKTKVIDFGASGACNINVLCPLGNGWEAERNSVALVLNALGQSWCSGAMVMNTCNTGQPFFLTANHCYATNPVQNVGAWRFTFQAWSAACTPSQNANGITYNGSTLRANWATSDFCLVELNNTPPANSGIHYAGWTRSTTAGNNATAIHHPRGDVMKISRAGGNLTKTGYGGAGNDHWQANWAQGVTEGGSSGSPLFDQNHRIVGQLHGGPSYCGAAQLWDYYGAFDVSWTGGGTNATRLSNWLDPSSTGATTTNTTNVATFANNVKISTTEPSTINYCATVTTTNLTCTPTVWSVTGPAYISGSYANAATIMLTGNGNVVVTATAGAFSDSRTYTGNYNTAYNSVATGLQTSSPYYPYGPSSYYGYYINFTPIPGVTSYHMEWFDVTTNSLLNTYPITYTGTNSVFYYYFTSGHTYRYRLAALSPCGTKGPFSAWSGDMLPPPASCANGPYSSTLSQSRGCGTSGTGCPYTNLSWPAITGATQYKIEYNVFNTSTGYSYPTSTATTSYTSNPVYTSVPIPVVSGTGWYLKYRVSVNCGSGFGTFSGWSATFFLQ